MAKEDKMVTQRRQISAEMERVTINTINSLIANSKQVTVKTLMEITGYSRGYFYNNTKIYASIKNAYKLQDKMVFKRESEVAINKSIELELIRVEKENKELKAKLAEKDLEILQLKKQIISQL